MYKYESISNLGLHRFRLSSRSPEFYFFDLNFRANVRQSVTLWRFAWFNEEKCNRPQRRPRFHMKVVIPSVWKSF